MIEFFHWVCSPTDRFTEDHLRENPSQNHSYGFVKGENAILIDPAWQASVYTKELKAKGVKNLVVLLTHRHKDHCESVKELEQNWNCSVFLSQLESDFYNWLPENPVLLKTEDKALEVMGFQIKVYHTPGHTKGGLCFEVDGKLFTGDTLFIEQSGVCFCKGGSVKELFESFQKLKKVIAPKTLVFPGHEYRFKVGQTFSEVLKINRFFDKSSEEFCKLRERLDQRFL